MYETAQKLRALGEEEKQEDTAMVVVPVLLNASVAAAGAATPIAYSAWQWRSHTDKAHT